MGFLSIPAQKGTRAMSGLDLLRLRRARQADAARICGAGATAYAKNACLALLAAACCAISVSGCAKGDKGKEPAKQEDAPLTQEEGSKGKEQVELTVWGAKEDEGLMGQVIKSFQEYYQGEADFDITYKEQGESACKDALLGNLEGGADVFTFADDQLNALAAAGAVEPVGDEQAVKAGNIERAVEAACVDGTVYAYPLTADNGYFLYYNKEFFTEDDVRSLERILEIAQDNGKLFAMDWSSAWYVYAFFGNTGLEVGLNDDGITNFCTWNGKDGEIKGVDVAQAMLDIAKNPGFSSRTDEEFMKGVQDGSVIAGISGVWNAVAVNQAWGEDMGASKLPTYKCGGKNVQMASFSGCKLIGVNAYSSYPGWAAKLAEWITNEKNQALRFEMRGQGPSNQKAAQSAKVQQSAAIAALLEQSEFSALQRVGGNFWSPVQEFSANMLAGNPSGLDLQQQLDKMAEGVAAR